MLFLPTIYVCVHVCVFLKYHPNHFSIFSRLYIPLWQALPLGRLAGISNLFLPVILEARKTQGSLYQIPVIAMTNSFGH